MTTSAQVTDIKRKVYLFKESPAVLSTTTDSGGVNTKDSHNEFIKSYVDSKNYEHISDATLSPESEDTKGDGNNTSENTRSSGNMVISTLDPGNMRTVDIDTGPTDSAHQVYQTKVSPAKRSRTVGLGQLHQEELPGHIEQPESTSLGDEHPKKQVHRSSHRSAPRMDQTRNNHRAHLQQRQQLAQRQVLYKADAQRNSRKRSNMRGTLSLHRHGDARRMFHTTLENSRNITEKLPDSTVQERTTSTTYGTT